MPSAGRQANCWTSRQYTNVQAKCACHTEEISKSGQIRVSGLRLMWAKGTQRANLFLFEVGQRRRIEAIVKDASVALPQR